ncbi:MAG TPA: AAA family ATPase [Ktedonosporobacter sp.]|nr:AAA family ATPase [Ktedonosporobacter sp.]
MSTVSDHSFVPFTNPPVSTNVSPILPIITAFGQLQTEMSSLLIERDEAVHAALVALVAREHLLLIGPPGTAKSLLVTQLSRRITSAQGGDLSLFTWLMTKFTTPEDLYGPISLQGLKQDRYTRVTTGRLPTAKLVFLDEVLRGSDPILETLLTAMNEREFDNDGQRNPIPLLSLFGATNDVNVPSNTDGKIGAVWDRFLLRLKVDYVSESNFARMMQLTPSSSSSLQTQVSETDLQILQQYTQAIVVPAEIIEVLRQVRRELLDKKMVVSDRRWMQCLGLLRATALLAGRGRVENSDLKILQHVLWQKLDQRTDLTRMLVRLVSPYEGDILEIRDTAASCMKSLETIRADHSLDDEQQMKAAMEAMGKLRTSIRDLESLRKQMQGNATNTDVADQALIEVKQMITEVSELIVSPF